MILWEIRKSTTAILLLVAVILCCGWFFVCRNLFVGSYDKINGTVYKSYMTELSSMSREEQAEYIETEGERIRSVLAALPMYSSKYLHGEITDEEYTAYLEEKDACSARNETFQYIARKSERIFEDPNLCFIYDLELEGHLTTMTADFPLVVLMLVVGCGLFIADIPSEPFLRTCKHGREKTYISKFAAMLIIGVTLMLAFNIVELAALFSKDLGDLSAPAASMDMFAELDTDITCMELIQKTFLFRIIGEFTVCMMFFALSRLCRNYIAFISTATVSVIIPAFFVSILPRFVRGIAVYYSLSGGSILLDKSGVSVLLWSAALIAASLITAWKCRRV